MAMTNVIINTDFRFCEKNHTSCDAIFKTITKSSQFFDLRTRQQKKKKKKGLIGRLNKNVIIRVGIFLKIIFCIANIEENPRKLISFINL